MNTCCPLPISARLLRSKLPVGMTDRAATDSPERATDQWQELRQLAGANDFSTSPTDSEKVFAQLWKLTEEGRLPVVCDASSCTHGLTGLGKRLSPASAEKWEQLRFVDVVTFTCTELLAKLPLAEDAKVARVLVHPTCSAVHLGIVPDLVAVAEAAAEEVHIPEVGGCCGSAGDRSLLHPQLGVGATAAEVGAIERLEAETGPFTAYVSANRTCELGMTTASGRPFEHVLEVLDRVAARSQFS